MYCRAVFPKNNFTEIICLKNIHGRNLPKESAPREEHSQNKIFPYFYLTALKNRHFLLLC